MRRSTILLWTVPLLSILALGVTGCATLESLGGLGFERPGVSVDEVRLRGLTLSGVDLVFDLEVDNPNAFEVVLGRIDWGLDVEGRSLLEGEQREGLSIPSQGRETTQVPVRLDFLELYRAYESLRGRERANYELGADLWFDVPVVGAVRVPVTKRGEVPLRP